MVASSHCDIVALTFWLSLLPKYLFVLVDEDEDGAVLSISSLRTACMAEVSTPVDVGD